MATSVVLRGRAVLLAAIAGLAALDAPSTVAAQDTSAVRRPAPNEAPGGPPRTVTGRVVRPGDAGMLAVPRAWVTLHRVAPDSSGPVDSVRADGQGRYRVRYQPAGGDAVYFASSMFGGVAYFTPPLPPSDAGGDAGEITVFDTTSAALPIRTRGRHVVVSSSAVDGRRTLVEVFELSNDTTLTAVSGSRGRATWSAPLAPNATDFQVSQSDISSNAVSLRDGRVQVFASISPGIRQVAFSYAVPADDFPLTVPVPDTVGVFEVLLEDPGATVDGGGLAEQERVNLEGRTFRRFLGQDVPAGAGITITLGDPTGPTGNRFLLAPVVVAGIAMLIALAVALTRRRPLRAAAAAMAPRELDPSHLARDIAELDDALARNASPTDAELAAYRERRAALKRQLADALAKGEAAV